MLNLIGFSAQFIALVSIAAIFISCIFTPISASVVTVNESDATLPDASSSCAKSMMLAVITTTISDDVVTDDLSCLTIRELKALCKSRSIKGYSSLRKHELVALLSKF